MTSVSFSKTFSFSKWILQISILLSPNFYFNLNFNSGKIGFTSSHPAHPFWNTSIIENCCLSTNSFSDWLFTSDTKSSDFSKNLDSRWGFNFLLLRTNSLEKHDSMNSYKSNRFNICSFGLYFKGNKCEMRSSDAF